MKNLFLLMVSICIATESQAQYKQYMVSGLATTHNFNSGAFYSSPGLQATYRFDEHFSVEAGIAAETVKHHAQEFDFVAGGKYYINNTYKYVIVPVSFNYGFGDALRLEFGAGFTGLSNRKGYDDGYVQYLGSNGDTIHESFSNNVYTPRMDRLPFMFHINGSVSYSFAEHFVVGLKAQRSILHDFNQDDLTSFQYYNDYWAFRLMKFSVFMGYQFDIP